MGYTLGISPAFMRNQKKQWDCKDQGSRRRQDQVS